ncbi:ribonuclease H-like domain-containing protein [Tanacetum coccineum]
MTPSDPTWNIDTGASYHLNSNASNLGTIFNKRLFSSVHVGDGNSIPVTNTRHSIIPSIHRPLYLHNVLVTLNIIKNLIYVRQFTRDNNCTIKFDAFAFSVMDFLTHHILLRCDSSSDLYPVTKPSNIPIAFVSTSSSTWHQHLGHPGDEVLRSLMSRHSISGLVADGFNSFNNLSQSYNMWPVILPTYNIPPWLCMKETSFMLTLLIPGPKSSVKDIDVYLRPLIDDLKDLWELVNVETIDVTIGKTFNMRAMLLWTINDFPA